MERTPTTHSNVRQLPVRPHIGATSATLREHDPYALSPDFERCVVYLLCQHGRFFSAVSKYLQAKLFSSRIPQLLVDAAQTTAVALQHAPQDYRLVLETLAGWARAQKVTDDEVLEARQYLELAEDIGIADFEDVHRILRPVIQDRISLSIMTASREAYGKSKGVSSVEQLVKKYHEVSTIEASDGIAVDHGGVQEIRKLLTAERMSLGVQPIDDACLGGFYVSTTTNFIGGTGSGKSQMLMQGATHMALVRKENVTLATLELPQALQLARHFANALDLDFEEVLRKPEEALLRYQDLYPNAGRLKIRYFDGDSATMKHIKEWREDLKQEYGEDFRGNFIDYLNLLAPSKGNYDGDTKRLDLVSRELCEYGKSEMCWNYTASAPTRDNDKIEIKDASGKFKLPTNGGVGGAYAISKNVDNNVWLVRVAASEFDLENYDIYAVGTKDRLGASRKSMWISEPFKPNFINSRIDINTTHSAHLMVKREEVNQL